MAEAPETIFGIGLFSRIVLPLLLIFTVIFAILERLKLFGDDKKQMHAIIALVIAIITVAFAYPTDIIVKLMPFLAVAVVIVLIFLILYGMVSPGDKEKGLNLPNGLKIAFGVLIGIALIIAVLWATDYLDTVYSLIFKSGSSNKLLTNIVVLAAIAGALFVVLKKWK